MALKVDGPVADVPHMHPHGWHITSRNRAAKICLAGIVATDYDNFGAFEQLGATLMHLVGSKPVYVSVGDLPQVEPHKFARRLTIGLQQLRAVQVNLEGLELHADLPALSEKAGILFRGDRVLIGGPDLTTPSAPASEIYEALRTAARARKGAESVHVKAFADPRVLELCIALTGSACLARVPRSAIGGVYTVAGFVGLCCPSSPAVVVSAGS